LHSFAGVNRYQKSLLLFVVMAVPAAAHSAFVPKHAACFATGVATYQIAQSAKAPDFRIRIAGAADRPDLRMRPVDQPEIADFVLVDDAGEPDACRGHGPIQIVTLDAETPSPDVIVQLSADTSQADYTLYVRSMRFSPQEAAALFAAIWRAERHRIVAQTAR
jgi:hypothetical protein